MFKPTFRKRVEPFVPQFVLRWMDPFHTALNARLRAAAAAVPAGALVLDAGAGECPHAALFAHTRYIKIDRGIGDKTWDYSHIDVQADICDLPFPDAAFDAVVNIQVLEHIREPALCVREMARVLKPGGHLILTTVQDWEIHQHPNDFFRYTRYGLEYLFAKAGPGKPRGRPRRPVLEHQLPPDGPARLPPAGLALAAVRAAGARFRLGRARRLLRARSAGPPPRLHPRLFLLVPQTAGP